MRAAHGPCCAPASVAAVCEHESAARIDARRRFGPQTAPRRTPAAAMAAAATLRAALDAGVPDLRPAASDRPGRRKPRGKATRAKADDASRPRGADDDAADEASAEDVATDDAPDADDARRSGLALPGAPASARRRRLNAADLHRSRPRHGQSTRRRRHRLCSWPRPLRAPLGQRPTPSSHPRHRWCPLHPCAARATATARAARAVPDSGVDPLPPTTSATPLARPQRRPAAVRRVAAASRDAGWRRAPATATPARHGRGDGRGRPAARSDRPGSSGSLPSTRVAPAARHGRRDATARPRRCCPRLAGTGRRSAHAGTVGPPVAGPPGGRGRLAGLRAGVGRAGQPAGARRRAAGRAARSTRPRWDRSTVQIVIDGTQARVDFGADTAATRAVRSKRGLPELAAALREQRPDAGRRRRVRRPAAAWRTATTRRAAGPASAAARHRRRRVRRHRRVPTPQWCAVWLDLLALAACRHRQRPDAGGRRSTARLAPLIARFVQAPRFQ